METQILISGFGGQGLMSLGKLLAKAALKEGKYTTWFPSYGAEMRGGTAHCFVKISDSPIASPLVEYPNVAIILNQPSLEKFKKRLRKGSLLILNADLINGESIIKDVKKVSLSLNKMALDCGNIKVANIIALGALISLRKKIIKIETIVEVLKENFADNYTVEQNLKALYKGRGLC